MNQKDLSQYSRDILVRGEASLIRTYCDQEKILIKNETPKWMAVHFKGDQLTELLKQSVLEEIYWANYIAALLNDKVIGNAIVIAFQETGICYL